MIKLLNYHFTKMWKYLVGALISVLIVIIFMEIFASSEEIANILMIVLAVIVSVFSYININMDTSRGDTFYSLKMLPVSPASLVLSYMAFSMILSVIAYSLIISYSIMVYSPYGNIELLYGHNMYIMPTSYRNIALLLFSFVFMPLHLTVNRLAKASYNPIGSIVNLIAIGISIYLFVAFTSGYSVADTGMIVSMSLVIVMIVASIVNAVFVMLSIARSRALRG